MTVRVPYGRTDGQYIYSFVVIILFILRTTHIAPLLRARESSAIKKKKHFTLLSLLSGLFTFLPITFIEIASGRAVLVLLKQKR